MPNIVDYYTNNILVSNVTLDTICDHGWVQISDILETENNEEFIMLGSKKIMKDICESSHQDMWGYITSGMIPSGASMHIDMKNDIAIFVLD